MVKKKLLDKIKLYKEIRVELEDKIVVAKCDITDLLISNDPEKACEIVEVIPKKESDKDGEKGKQEGNNK